MDVLSFDLSTTTTSPVWRASSSWEHKGCTWTRGTEIHFHKIIVSDGLYKGRLIFPGSLPNQCRELSSPWPWCRRKAEHLELLWWTRGIILYRLCRELWETAFLRLVLVVMYLISVWPSASKLFTAYVFHTLVEVHWGSSGLSLPAAQTESLSALACFEIPVQNHSNFTEE